MNTDASGIIDSPVGPLRLESRGDSLTTVWLRAEKPRTWPRLSGVLAETRRQLDAYFAGRLTEFEIPVDPAGTSFQLTVWRTLREIAYGETWSYSDVARRIGRPDAVRAVGAANGRNPIPIIIPCHRVIGSNGRLVGFGGGIEMKQTLLALEARRLF